MIELIQSKFKISEVILKDTLLRNMNFALNILDTKERRKNIGDKQVITLPLDHP